MSVTTYYQVNNYYLLIEPGDAASIDLDLESSSRSFVREELLSKFESGKRYTSTDLTELAEKIHISKRYICIRGERYIAFYSQVNLGYLMHLLFPKTTVRNLNGLTKAVINEFRHNRKEGLLQSITGQKKPLGRFLETLTSYVFCEHYSLWVYNNVTGFFTREASSFDEDLNYMRADESCGLTQILREDYEGWESRPLSEKYHQFEYLKSLGINTVNRIKLEIGESSQPAVVSFYSTKHNFSLNRQLVTRLKRLVESRYLEEIERLENQFREFSTEVSPSVGEETKEQYLYRFVQKIAKCLKYEAASILLENSKGDYELVATKDSRCNGEPSTQVIYKTNMSSLSMQVINKNSPMICYDIESDDANSHHYDETTESAPQNWVGVPIKLHDTTIGLLRVKNKFFTSKSGEKSIKPPMPINLFSLLEAADLAATSIELHTKYNDVNASLSDQKNFLRVLLHEIRTPISKFWTGPDLIKRGLKKEAIPEEKKQKYLNQLSDIQVLGGRLKLITDSYNIDSLINTNVFEKIPLLHGIIFPLLNITKPYLEKQHDCDLVVDQKSMRSLFVLGDKQLYAIALNALIDNAAKYYTESSTIHVKCDYKYGDEFLFIAVENRGFPILEEEREKIFLDTYRGINAKKTAIHGSGIGLFLARKIMRQFGGDLFYIPEKNPNLIVFRMKFPVSEETQK